MKYDLSIAYNIKHLALKVAALIKAYNYYFAIGCACKLWKVKGGASSPEVLDKLRLGQTSEARYQPVGLHLPISHPLLVLMFQHDIWNVIHTSEESDRRLFRGQMDKRRD